MSANARPPRRTTSADGRSASTAHGRSDGNRENAMDSTAQAADTGATAVEYALIVVAIAAVIAAVVMLFGGAVNHMFSNSCAAVNSDGATTVATTTCG